MNTLQSNLVSGYIHKWPQLVSELKDLREEVYPVQVEGLHGSLSAFFLAEYISYNKTPVSFVVVPGEREAHDVTVDLKAANPKTATETAGFL